SRVRLVADGEGRAGLRAHHSHRVVALHDCPIAVPGELDDVLARRWRPGSEVEVTRDDDGGVHVRELSTVRGKVRARQLAGRAVVESIAAGSPDRIVYVACDPAALARDLAFFGKHGYALTDLRAFDAFPMTHHVECVALLS